MIDSPSNRDADAAIRSTDTDASQSRLSAVRRDYLKDPFIHLLVPRAHSAPPRPPLINIGTYVRAEAIDKLVYRWLNLRVTDNRKKQVVSLGAGSDTRFWRIASSSCKERLARYVEIDFPEVTGKKAMSIRKHKELSILLGENVKIIAGGTGLSAEVYHLEPIDLRLPPESTLGVLVQNGVLDPTLPTLFIAECVFVYLRPSVSHGIVSWFTSTITGGCSGLIYEMFGLNDSFGRVMKENLRARNIEIPGVEESSALEAQLQRLFNGGIQSAQAMTLRTVRQKCISEEELSRISRLEMLDEVEELDLVLSHYVLTWGYSLPNGVTDEEREHWKAWEL
ncbi:leucine carboxyl methyltransferase [Sistotremastrum niveocremeum HHB9708]|uniref:Leucine carboxyl methyltransferase 1 n=1 Tax=Sistotremastrum niveocremeum HHB9708 TaxID=1314777 RepID=A0A164N2R1_9AGAM|nr:leucine carboxyl methyltransferase [Sistotremastrum niveocremeum HHB9708]